MSTILTAGSLLMPLLPRKSILAIAAVVDVAIHARSQAVAAKALAARHQLSPRHLEPVLQALVHNGVLKGVRGPHGGYELAREPRRISVDDIVRAVETVEEKGEKERGESDLINRVVMPALAQADEAFSATLCHINVEDLMRSAAVLKSPFGA
jgi:Rrf2 family transcriptional regulator, iron-sulfur cluster assembly transcription factor